MPFQQIWSRDGSQLGGEAGRFDLLGTRRPYVKLFPSAHLSAACLVLSVDNMKTSVSGSESLNGAAEPGRDLLEIDVFDGTKAARAKNRCDASGLETADRAFVNVLKLFGPLLF